MGASPTPTTKVQWDGTRGHAWLWCTWDGSHTLNIQDSLMVDVSSLSNRPEGDRLKIRSVDILINSVSQGAMVVDLEFFCVAGGQVDTGVAGNDVAWVSGDKFADVWLSEGPGNIGIDGLEYPILSITDDENMVVDTPVHNGAAFWYVIDQLVGRYNIAAGYSGQILQDFTPGPSNGCVSDASSTSFVGDIRVTSTGAGSGDSLSLYIVFERT